MSEVQSPRRMTNPFERYLTVWVALCIVGGILLGKIAPSVATALDGDCLRIRVGPYGSGAYDVRTRGTGR